MNSSSGYHFVSLAEVLQRFEYHHLTRRVIVILRVSEGGEADCDRVLLYTSPTVAETAIMQEGGWYSRHDTFKWNLERTGSFILGKMAGVRVTDIRLERKFCGSNAIVIEAERLSLSYLGWSP